MGIARVIRRELNRIAHHPRYLIILTLGCLFTFVFFATFMREGQPQNLPVAVVDMDGTYFTRRLCHEINATQGVEVVAVYNNHTEARKAMQRGEIFAFYEIPHGTYNDLLQFRSPHFGLYSNPCYLLAGTLSYKQLATMGMLAAGAVQREVYRKKGYDEEQIMGLIMPIEFDTHLVGNPWANYQIYLMTTIVPGVISFIVLLFTVYMIGREREEGSMGSLLRKTGGNPFKALVGKMLPYTCWFSLLMVSANFIMFGVMKFPLEGSWLLMVLASILLVIGVQCVGVFIAGALPDPHISMGVSAVYGALCFSLSGFSFPIEAMPNLFSSLCYLYPLRHYYLIYSDVAIFGNGFGHCWPHICAMLVFGVAFLLGAWMLGKNWRVATTPKVHDKKGGMI
ncbi:MAG: ABC transporter permease [Bacteroidales bacterium]|nr:ABC transporter permease [Bacteroidales bacterium]